MRATSRRSVRFKLDEQVNVRALRPRVPGRERRTHDRGTISEGKQGSLTIVPLSLALPCYSFWLFRAATHESGNRNDFIIPAETIGVTYPASLRHSGPTRPPSPMCIALLGLWVQIRGGKPTNYARSHQMPLLRTGQSLQGNDRRGRRTMVQLCPVRSSCQPGESVD
jgi:hypothetical protein